MGFIIRRFISPHHTMLPPMKSMKAGAAKAMTKGALLKAIATEHGLKTKACSNVLNSLVTVAAKEVKKTGVFPVPGLCRIKTSKDSCESFSSCCTQEADLKRLSTICTAPSWKPYYCGNPTVEARMCSILGPLGHDSCTYSPGCS